MAANADKFIEEPKTITAALRLQAMMLAKMNEERAELCGRGQEGLKTIFDMNAQLLMRIAE